MLRTKILPRSLQDFCVTTFLILIIPVVYWFELFVVLVRFYEQWSLWYTFHFVTGTYVLINISTNYVAVVLCDTSIKGRVLPGEMAQGDWHLCSVCEAVVPPRSWHCNTCNICILRRDHHCMFTSCCIGHYNYRYFLMFVFYMFVATLYATYHNTYFIFEVVEFKSILSYVNLVFPLAMLFVQQSYAQMYLFLYLTIVIGCVFTGVLFYYHLDLMVRGLVTYEKNHKISKYDLGKLENVRVVFGEKWYLVWLSPFVRSKLPHDGMNWIVTQKNKDK